MLSRVFHAWLVWFNLMLIVLASWGLRDLKSFAGEWPRLLLLPVWLSLSIYGAISNTRTSGSTGKSEVRSHRKALWFFMPFLVAWFVYLPYADQHQLGTSGSRALRWVGLVIYAAMHWLRIESIRAQGQQFSFAVTIQEGHKLTTHGPYRWMRHPAYSGALGMVLGLSLIFANPIAGMVMTVLVWLWMEMRIRDEERLLLAEFGEKYADYRRRTQKLVPLVY
jgi:protein-S-isoprenylcysteine O-methyltransferase Ste14